MSLDPSAPEPHESRYSLADASILVCGASGGLGTAIAHELHRRSARLTLVAQHIERLEAIPVPGRRLAIDLRTAEGCDAAVHAALDHGGRLDVVINAVGVVAFGPVVDLSIDAMEELFLTNTFVPILLARAALPELAENGAVVNISGVIAEQNLPGMAVYGASKAAVRALDQALAREAKRSRIRIVDARPPHTETDLANRAIEGRAPRMPAGLDPARVATVICDGLEAGVNDLPSELFTAT